MKKVGYLVKQIHQLNQSQLNQMFAQFDLTASQTFTLIYLFRAHAHNKQVKQKDIEEAFDSSNPTVTGILNRLEAKGLIKRIACKDDARAKNICVTPKALEIDVMLKEMFDKNEKQLVSSLSKEEQEQLVYLLEKVLNNM